MAAPYLWYLFDKVRSLTRSGNLFRHENILQDQSSLKRILNQSGDFMNFSQQASLIDQTNLQINRLERYKDFDQMDETGEIFQALDMYADEASLIDPEKKHSIMVRSSSATVKKTIEDFLYNTLMIDHWLRPWIRSLCKYGDLALEIIPTRDRTGVASLRPMSIYNFTRVETKYGDLVGFFHQDALTPTPEFFHPWQVMHCRLISLENIYRPYGKSILEGARKHFKQLRLMEDAALIYRICLKGDSRVWTPTGYKYIRDVKPGDTVYSFSKDLKLKETKVIYSKCNGNDKLYTIRSMHREITGNATHPVLVECPDGSAKYVDMADIIPGVHKLITPAAPENKDYVQLEHPKTKTMARLAQAIKLEAGMAYIGRKIGINKKQHIEQFLDDTHLLEEGKATAIIEYAGGDPGNLEISKAWAGGNGEKEFYPPVVADEKFARWFGFMIGDGYVSQRKNGALNEVGFACGDDSEINEFYRNLFSTYVGASASGYKNGRLNKYYTYSKAFAEFMGVNGYIGGAHNKRIPEWVWRSPRSVQEAFIDGYVDADGHRKIFKGGVTESIELCCCNKLLMEDFKELCHKLGWRVGKVRERERKAHIIEGNREIKSTISYELHLSKTPQKMSENVLSVERAGEDLVYDIGVDSDEHNFAVDGCIVHNTRAPEKRVFTIPVGNMPSHEISGYMVDIARSMKKKQFLDPGTGNVNERWNPLIQEDDFFLPKRADGEQPSIDTLPGAENLDQIADIEYFKKKMVSALKIPMSRVGIGDTAEADSKPLSQSAPEFAKAIQHIQREMALSIKKVVIVHMALMGYSLDQLKDFDLYMAASSSVDALFRIEAWQTRADIIDKLKSTEMFSDSWIMENFTDLTSDEISDMEEERRLQAELQQLMGGGGGGPGMGGLGGGPSGGLGPPGGMDLGGGLGGGLGEPPGGGLGGGPLGMPEDKTNEKLKIINEELTAVEYELSKLDNDSRKIIIEDKIKEYKDRRRDKRSVVLENDVRGASKFQYLMEHNEFDGLKYKTDSGKELLIESPIDKKDLVEALEDTKRLIGEDNVPIIGTPETITDMDIPK